MEGANKSGTQVKTGELAGMSAGTAYPAPDSLSACALLSTSNHQREAESLVAVASSSTSKQLEVCTRQDDEIPAPLSAPTCPAAGSEERKSGKASSVLGPEGVDVTQEEKLTQEKTPAASRTRATQFSSTKKPLARKAWQDVEGKRFSKLVMNELDHGDHHHHHHRQQQQQQTQQRLGHCHVALEPVKGDCNSKEEFIDGSTTSSRLLQLADRALQKRADFCRQAKLERRQFPLILHPSELLKVAVVKDYHNESSSGGSSSSRSSSSSSSGSCCSLQVATTKIEESVLPTGWKVSFEHLKEAPSEVGREMQPEAAGSGSMRLASKSSTKIMMLRTRAKVAPTDNNKLSILSSSLHHLPEEPSRGLGCCCYTCDLCAEACTSYAERSTFPHRKSGCELQVEQRLGVACSSNSNNNNHQAKYAPDKTTSSGNEHLSAHLRVQPLRDGELSSESRFNIRRMSGDDDYVDNKAAAASTKISNQNNNRGFLSDADMSCLHQEDEFDDEDFEETSLSSAFPPATLMRQQSSSSSSLNEENLTPAPAPAPDAGTNQVQEQVENGSSAAQAAQVIDYLPVQVAPTFGVPNKSLRSSLDLKRKFRALGQLVSFVQTSRNFSYSSDSIDRDEQEPQQVSGTSAGSPAHQPETSSGIAARQPEEREQLPAHPVFTSAPNESNTCRSQVPVKPATTTAPLKLGPPPSSVLLQQARRGVTSSRAAKTQAKPQPKRARQDLEMRREKKAAKTLAIITGIFVCCWLPFFLNAIIMPICGPSCTPSDLILSILLWLGYLNSLLNPIIYTIFSPDFRRAFRRLLCWPPHFATFVKATRKP